MEQSQRWILMLICLLTAAGLTAGAWADPTPVGTPSHLLPRHDPASRLKPKHTSDRLKPKHPNDKLKPKHPNDRLKPKHPSDRLKRIPTPHPTLSREALQSKADRLKDKKDSEGEMGQEQALKIQAAMDRQSKMEKTISNTQKKQDDANNALIKNQK